MCKERLHEIAKEVNFVPENLEWKNTMKQGFVCMDDEVEGWKSHINETTCRCEL